MSMGENRLVWLSSISALAEEQHAGRGEREVEPREDPRLRLGVEVHQRVAAQQQVDPRDRGVLHQVVPPEDHRAAQVLAEMVTTAAVLEVPVEQLGRNALTSRWE
jgi:hypothetical protein